MFGMKGPELLIIVGVIAALFIFGPKNLPKLGKSLGKTVKSVREGMDGKFDEEAADKNGEQTAAPVAPPTASAAAPEPVTPEATPAVKEEPKSE